LTASQSFHFKKTIFPSKSFNFHFLIKISFQKMIKFPSTENRSNNSHVYSFQSFV
jgi:hypothetical protein